jgi:hypothetical protein
VCVCVFARPEFIAEGPVGPGAVHIRTRECIPPNVESFYFEVHILENPYPDTVLVTTAGHVENQSGPGSLSLTSVVKALCRRLLQRRTLTCDLHAWISPGFMGL